MNSPKRSYLTLAKVVCSVLLLILIGSVTFSGCTVTRHISSDNPLYVGMKKTRISNQDGSVHGEKTLSAVENVISAKPNNAFFGGTKQTPLIPPIGLWLHDRLIDDSTKIGRWLYKRFASKPVLIKAVNPTNRARVATGILRENGYFHGSVRGEVVPTKDSLKVFARYYVDMGPVSKYDSISPLPADRFEDSTLLSQWEYKNVAKGKPFDLSDLLAERAAVSEAMRDTGYYYFRPDAILFQADTFKLPGTVWLRPSFESKLSPRVFRRWSIGDIRVSIVGPNGQSPNDSLEFDGMHLRYFSEGPKRKPIVRPAALRRRIQFARGLLYAQQDERISRRALSRLGAFSSMDFRFRVHDPADSVSKAPGVLDFDLLMTPDRPWDVSLEMLVKTKSNNFVGPGVRFTMGRRNVFGAGERLAFDVYGSYEWQTGRRPEGSRAVDINSYEVGSSVNLNFPSIVFPVFINRYYTFPTTTNFQLSASMLNRAGFFRIFSFGTAATYEIEPSSQHKHLFTPLRINYNLLQHRTGAFEDILAENPALALSLQSQFISQIGYTYTYSNFFGSSGRHHLWMQYGLSEAGNLLNAGFAIAGKKYSETKDALWAPFAQFVKVTAEWRYTYMIDRNQSLATRLGAGVIYSFGNMRIAPYSEQFYVGGANSIRAFTVRSIGPGNYAPNPKDKYAFIDQIGDVKLEANIEYRTKIIGNLGGAIFLDAGNVWLIRRDETRPGGAFGEINSARDFFDQLALGTGLGLRYDLDFLVVRLDAGIGLHLPYETNRTGYYNIPNFRDALGIHLAIGYPF